MSTALGELTARIPVPATTGASGIAATGLGTGTGTTAGVTAGGLAGTATGAGTKSADFSMSGGSGSSFTAGLGASDAPSARSEDSTEGVLVLNLGKAARTTPTTIIALATSSHRNPRRRCE